MILVNSGTSSDLKTVKPADWRKSFLTTTATNGLFAAQDSTFEPLYRPMFQSLGVDGPILLDFFSVAGFEARHEPLLQDLDELAFHAAHNVHCFDGDRLVKGERLDPPRSMPSGDQSIAHLRRKGGDCLSENFYRVGSLGKTTYLSDERFFRIFWQLGRLSVRMNGNDILAPVG